MAEGDGLLNVDQHFGHLCFSTQIVASQSLPRSSDVAAVGSGSPVLGARRDNSRDSADLWTALEDRSIFCATKWRIMSRVPSGPLTSSRTLRSGCADQGVSIRSGTSTTWSEQMRYEQLRHGVQ